MVTYDLFTYTVLEEYEPEKVVFRNVVFLKKFGPWRTGQTLAAIRVNFEAGVMEELLDDLTTVVKSQAFRIVDGEVVDGALKIDKCINHYIVTLGTEGVRAREITVVGSSVADAIVRLANELKR